MAVPGELYALIEQAVIGARIEAPGVFEVEFNVSDGRTYGSLALRADQLLVLHHRPIEVA